jgi:hypothetical protein
MSNIDFFARECHHIKHAQVLASAFDTRVKTKIEDCLSDYVCVFSYGDLKIADHAKKKIIFCEHGVGMYYENDHPSYAGSLKHRERVVLRLSPNTTHAEKERETLKCPVEIIGVPKLDKYANRHWRLKTYDPVVAISFHWDCLVNTETRSAFRVLPDLLHSIRLSVMDTLAFSRS